MSGIVAGVGSVGKARALRQRLLFGTALAGLAAAGILVWTSAAGAQALPQGESVRAGDVSVARPSANSLLVTQTSATGIVDWQSFSIGGGATAHFQNGTGATLNRVTGNDPSAIHGTLSATGSLYVVNQAGVTVGPGGRVLTGGTFVASTHDVSDAEFTAGRDMVFSGSSRADVINHGTIRSAMGDVALIARRVENTGEIDARNGTAGLLAGYEVLMREASGAGGKFAVRVGGGDTEAVNSGTVRAAEIELRANGGNVYALGINTKGVLKATGAKKKGGRIFLTAEGGKVEAGGTVRAQRKAAPRKAGAAVKQKAKGGEVIINADAITISGHIDVSGTGGGDGGRIEAIATGAMLVAGTARLDASGAAGGFVETSGAQVRVDHGASVTTLGAAGPTGTWLIDPTDFVISAGNGAQTQSGIGADTLAANLVGSNVALTTAAAGGEAGDIHVNAAVAWDAATTLTLTAHHDILIDAATAGRNGGLTLNAAGAITTTSAGTVDVGTFTLLGGDWKQVGALPAFDAADFRLSGGSFLRATGGDGSAATPWLVADAYGLQGIGSSIAYRAANWALAADIDAAGTAHWNGGLGFNPIGNDSSRFSGTFDGQGHVVSGLTIDRPSQNYVGLFGYTNNATIRNVGLEGGAVRGANQVGGLVGYQLGGSISQAYATGAVTGAGLVGGLVGYQLGSISQAYATGAVTGNFAVGGLVGQQGGGTITQSYATGMVTGSGIYVGGLVGYQSSGSSISQAYATGAVTGSDFYVGGLVGQSHGSIGQAYATGTVTGTNVVGGLVGSQAGSGNISQAYAIGTVAGSGTVGGLVGEQYGTISQAYASGAVTGSYAIGGLVGYQGGTVNASFWDTQTTGRNASQGRGGGSGSFGAQGKTTAELMTASTYAGWSVATIPTATLPTADWLMLPGETRPFGAWEHSTTISNAHQLQLMAFDLDAAYTLAGDIDLGAALAQPGGMWRARGWVPVDTFSGTFDGRGHVISGLKINRPTQSHVGLFSSTLNATIRNVGLEGGSVIGSYNVGGLVGYQGGGSISQAYATGSVTGVYNVGGLVGQQFVGSISQAYATGNVTGTSSGFGAYVGGLVGIQYDGSISQAYATGNVTGTGIGNDAYVGGLVGVQYGSISQAYATGNVTGTSTGSNAYVGGLVGVQGGGSISQAYATGNVAGTGTGNGGIGPYSYVGGLVGYQVGGTVSASFWDMDTTGRSASQGRGGGAGTFSAQGLVTAQMQDTAGFMARAQGWDFETVWAPPSAGYHPELYALSPVVRIDAGQFSREYGEADPVFTGTLFGGPGFYVFGPAGDAIGPVVQFSTTAGIDSGVGTYAIVGSGGGVSDGGVPYRVVVIPGELKITPARLNVAALAGSKVYGAADPLLTYIVVSGFKLDDDEALMGGGLVRDAGENAGTYAIRFGDLSAGPNYTIAFTGADFTIAQKQLTLTGLTGLDKVYDGTTGLVGWLPGQTFSVDGIVGGDDVTVAASSASYDSRDAGDRTVTASGLTLTGAASGNYTLGGASTVTGTGTITPLRLRITPVEDQGKVYGDADPGFLDYFVYADGPVHGGDSVSGSLARVAGEDAGLYAFRLGDVTVNDGNGGNNYDIAFNSDAAWFLIAPATLTVAALDATKAHGEADPVFGYIASGFKRGDDYPILSGALSRAPGEAAGAYAIGQGSLAAGANYTIDFSGALLTILAADTPAPAPTPAGAAASAYERPGDGTLSTSPTAAGDDEPRKCVAGVLGPDCEHVPHPANRAIGALSFLAE